MNITPFKRYKSNTILIYPCLIHIIKPKLRLKIVKLLKKLIALIDSPHQFIPKCSKESMILKPDCLDFKRSLPYF